MPLGSGVSGCCQGLRGSGQRNASQTRARSEHEAACAPAHGSCGWASVEAHCEVEMTRRQLLAPLGAQCCSRRYWAASPQAQR